MDNVSARWLARPWVGWLVRVGAMLAVVGNIAYNALYARTSGGADTIAAVTARHPSPFTPAPYAFSIWILIYAGFAAYAVWQLAPRRHDALPVIRASLWLIAINVLASAWIVLFTHERLVAALLPLAAGFACAIGFRAATRRLAPWTRAVASLYLGWSAVAALAGVAVWLAPPAQAAATVADSAWATLLMLAAFGFAVMELLDGDAVVPAVIAWALAAIFVAARAPYPAVAFIALALAVVVACSVLATLRRVLRARRYSSILYPRP
ncbi:MAG: tryptophan-rich sensory protein [Proteobacteria bacterium]|nr:tryptophan-rich sensory protein [Pseudomonadota bacterium]